MATPQLQRTAPAARRHASRGSRAGPALPRCLNSRAISRLRARPNRSEGCGAEWCACHRSRCGLSAAISRVAEAELGLTDPCGMPVCATVRPPGTTWS
ncbi:DUF5990 family protein [Streptomyces sp. NPDC001549]|uniref:DUF5990 family protein n=1 Tax=Streptomyces sp. NPDC001549 TaxID=3364586 RepID=UPI00369B4772